MTDTNSKTVEIGKNSLKIEHLIEQQYREK